VRHLKGAYLHIAVQETIVGLYIREGVGVSGNGSGKSFLNF
jgi:hypothetical protein